jgi:hypothetical protein
MELASSSQSLMPAITGSQILQQSTAASQFREEQFAYLPNNDWSLLTQFEESDYTGRFEDETRNYNTETEFYSYEGPNIVAATTGGTPATLRRRVLYEGVDEPLWMYDASVSSSVYFELDTIGNVRRVRGGKALSTSPPLASDLGGYRYTAFGRLNTVDTTTAYPSIAGTRYNQPLRWQSHWFIDAGPGFYDFRARVWSPDLATFLQPDEYGFLSRTGTLWSWPGQDPFRWRIRVGGMRVSGFCGTSANLKPEIRGGVSSAARRNCLPRN